jgi:hypothetical protein
MSLRIQELSARSAQQLSTRWPLEDMLGADYTGNGYTVSVLVSASDSGVAGETSLFVTVTKP